MPPDPDPNTFFSIEPEPQPRLRFIVIRGRAHRWREVAVVRVRRFARREHGEELLKLSRSNSPKKLKADIDVPALNPGSLKNK